MAEEIALDGVERPMDARQDAELLADARKGDVNRFGELVLRHQDKLYNLAFRMSGNAEDAAEITQETLLKAWRAMKSFRGDSAFYTWLFRIAVNEARSRRRYSSSRPTPVSLESMPAGQMESAGGSAADPVEVAAGRENKALVQQALNRLDPEQRIVIVLRDIEGRDYDEIASALDCPRGTVKSRLHRARMALKALLKPAIEADVL